MRLHSTQYDDVLATAAQVPIPANVLATLSTPSTSTLAYVLPSDPSCEHGHTNAGSISPSATPAFILKRDQTNCEKNLFQPT